MEVVEKVFGGLVLTELSLPEQSGDMTSEIVVILAFDTFKIWILQSIYLDLVDSWRTIGLKDS